MKLFVLALCSIALNYSNAYSQIVSRMVITDNLSSSSKLTYGKPKPAEAKSEFFITEEKGTQVLIYTDLLNDEVNAETFKLLFTAYKTGKEKEEWVDDRIIDVKKSSSYSLTAFNFFEEGSYRITVCRNESRSKILAEGMFQVKKED